MPKGKRGFQKGNTIGSQGRPKGAEGAAKREIKEYAQAFLTRPDYVLNIEERIFAGEAPNIELALYHYAYGKPVDRLALTNQDGTKDYGSLFLDYREQFARSLVDAARRRQSADSPEPSSQDRLSDKIRLGTLGEG